MTALLNRLTLPGAMVRRGFSLYVWRVDTGDAHLHYVGRTGDNSSPHATAPYTRMGQHLGFLDNQNALRKHLTHRGIIPEDCVSFDLISHGPIYPEIVKAEPADRDTDMAAHMPLRDQVGAMEKLLCDGLKAGGYDVMNTVNCKWVLTAEGTDKWHAAKKAFRSEFPNLK